MLKLLSKLWPLTAAVLVGLLLGGWGVYSLLLNSSQQRLVQATLGDSHAQLQVAEAYVLGHSGLALAPEKALYWLERAAAQGHLDAQKRLGLHLAFSEDPEQAIRGRDLLTGLVHHLPTAEQGETMFLLGLSHVMVKPFIPQRAAGWYVKAMHLGNERAINALTTVFTYQDENVPRQEKGAALDDLRQQLQKLRDESLEAIYSIEPGQGQAQ